MESFVTIRRPPTPRVASTPSRRAGSLGQSTPASANVDAAIAPRATPASPSAPPAARAISCTARSRPMPSQFDPPARPLPSTRPSASSTMASVFVAPPSTPRTGPRGSAIDRPDADLHDARAYARPRIAAVSLCAQIIVSTHFDDAVLSLAHVLQAAGPLATVVTVCGGAPRDGLPVSEWDAGCGFAGGQEAARARAVEDAAACAVTGARPLPLDHADTPYALLPDAAALQAEIAPLLRGDCTLWLPGGIGNPDHAHVRDALLPLAADGQIYVDLPYAGALELAGTNELRLTPAALERKLAAVRCHASQLSSLQRTWPALLDPAGPLARERFGQVALAASATWPSARP